GTFHHLIALFCTVAGKARQATGESTKFCNEIKDLEPDSEVDIGQMSLLIKHLHAGMQVICKTGHHRM
ncbi:MAG TPA: hypothetical protein PLR92_08790, partial [Alicycliphilus denitrificans]|nr:hypothetical protein [Alicycliphilus denitrificans]